MNSQREVEAKFDADDVDLTNLDDVTAIGDYLVVSRAHKHQVDTYFDTEDGRLAAARSSFRLRQSGDRFLMTFKGRREMHADDEAHVASRSEEECEVSPEDASSFLAGPMSLLTAHYPPIVRARDITMGSPLAMTARLNTERTVILLAKHRGDEIELAVDRCVGTRLADDRETTFAEIELESKGASRDALLNVAQHLMNIVPGLRPNLSTKLERTLT